MVDKRAIICPGQGSQFVTMGKEVAEHFPVAKHLFEEVDDALGQSLSKIIFEGPEEALTMTENTQPALMAVSLAMIRVIESEGNVKITDLCEYIAGHSLGEYSALAAAGSLTVADTAKLLRIRGSAMQEAVPAGKGGMAALIGVEFDKAAEIAEKAAEGDICQAANDNGGGQVVLSGTAGAIDRAVALAGELGIKRAVKLPVSAPFHSNLMEPAAEKMAEALANADLKAPAVPLVANVTAQAETDPETIKRLLVKQVTGTVRWRESVLFLKSQGVSDVTEIGAGKVLAGLVKRIYKEITTRSVQTTEDIENFLKEHA